MLYDHFYTEARKPFGLLYQTLARGIDPGIMGDVPIMELFGGHAKAYVVEVMMKQLLVDHDPMDTIGLSHQHLMFLANRAMEACDGMLTIHGTSETGVPITLGFSNQIGICPRNDEYQLLERGEGRHFVVPVSEGLLYSNDPDAHSADHLKNAQQMFSVAAAAHPDPKNQNHGMIFLSSPDISESARSLATTIESVSGNNSLRAAKHCISVASTKLQNSPRFQAVWEEARERFGVKPAAPALVADFALDA